MSCVGKHISWQVTQFLMLCFHWSWVDTTPLLFCHVKLVKQHLSRICDHLSTISPATLVQGHNFLCKLERQTDYFNAKWLQKRISARPPRSLAGPASGFVCCSLLALEFISNMVEGPDFQSKYKHHWLCVEHVFSENNFPFHLFSMVVGVWSKWLEFEVNCECVNVLQTAQPADLLTGEESGESKRSVVCDVLSVGISSPSEQGASVSTTWRS